MNPIERLEEPRKPHSLEAKQAFMNESELDDSFDDQFVGPINNNERMNVSKLLVQGESNLKPITESRRAQSIEDFEMDEAANTMKNMTQQSEIENRETIFTTFVGTFKSSASRRIERNKLNDQMFIEEESFSRDLSNHSAHSQDFSTLQQENLVQADHMRLSDHDHLRI